MAEPCEVQPLAAPAPLPPTSLADPVAAVAAQLVVDVIEPLSMQRLQGAAETPATCADDGRGAQTLEAAPVESSDPAPADADGHAAAASLPDGPLCHAVQEGTLLHDPGKRCSRHAGDTLWILLLGPQRPALLPAEQAQKELSPGAADCRLHSI